MNQFAIVGGGIGGLALANVLEQYKIPYQLYERAAQFSELGAGIGLSEATLAIFERLGLKEKMVAQGKFIQHANIVTKKRKLIRALPTDGGGICIHRAKLVETLAANLPSSKLHLNHHLKAFEQEQKGVQLTFEAEKQAHFDWVVACDGINSAFRQQLFPSIQKRYSGQTIWRGIAHTTLSADFEDTYYEYWGNNLRFAIIPMKDGTYYWYAVQYASAGEREQPAETQTLLLKLFEGYSEEVAAVIKASPNIIRDDMWDLKPHSKPWHQGNVIFMGDAIHATTPNLAQGGCQAIEDALTLGLALKKYPNIKEAITQYERLRRPKTTYIVKNSWQFGKISHQSNVLSEAWAKFLFRRLLPNSFFKKQYEKLIDIDYLEQV